MIDVADNDGFRQFRGWRDRTKDDEIEDGHGSCLDLVGELFFGEIEFDGLGAVAGAFLLLLFTATGVLLGGGAMAKNGKVGGKGHQQDQGYVSRFSHVQSKVTRKYKKSL
jgi:hypothetical protein